MREKNGKATLIIEDRIRTEPNAPRDRDVESAVRQYVRLLESYVRRLPGSYRAWHEVGTK